MRTKLMIRAQTSDMLCVDPYEECCCCCCCCCWLAISVSPRFEWQAGISQLSCEDEEHHANLSTASLSWQFTFISFLWTLTHRRRRVDRTRVRNKKGPVTLGAATILPDLTSEGVNRKCYLSWRHVNWSSRQSSTKEDKLFFPRVYTNRHARGHCLDHIISVDCTGMAMSGRVLILNHTAKTVRVGVPLSLLLFFTENDPSFQGGGEGGGDSSIHRIQFKNKNTVG